jgi:tetratricopeptide (TPR) repeat protein
MSSILLGALSFLFLFSPFFLGLGWMWVMVLWILVFWAYGARASRTVSLLLLLLLLLLPTGIRLYSSLLFSLVDNGIPEILRANTGAWDGELYQKLLAMNHGNPQDPDVLQATGLLEKRMGKFKEAEQRFLQMAQLDSRSGSALTNLGNIYLANNRLDQAIEAYRKAIQLEPSREEAYYNLGQAYLLKLQMKEAEAEFEKAKSLAPRAISYYTSISSRNFNRLVIDRTIDPVRVWQRIVAIPGQRDRIAGALWGILFGGVPLKYGEMAMGALFLLLGVVHLVTQQLPNIRLCDRCGQLICSRCTRSRVMGNQCVQCLQAFTVNPSADPKVVKKKRTEAARYQSWLVSLPQRISLIIPGFGHLFCDRGKEGILYLFISMLFLSKVLFWVWQLPNPLALNSTLSYPWVVILAVLFFLFYSFVQYRIKKVRIQGGKSHFRRA